MEQCASCNRSFCSGDVCICDCKFCCRKICEGCYRAHLITYTCESTKTESKPEKSKPTSKPPVCPKKCDLSQVRFTELNSKIGDSSLRGFINRTEHTAVCFLNVCLQLLKIVEPFFRCLTDESKVTLDALSPRESTVRNCLNCTYRFIALSDND
jgi:hypothetical protein